MTINSPKSRHHTGKELHRRDILTLAAGVAAFGAAMGVSGHAKAQATGCCPIPGIDVVVPKKPPKALAKTPVTSDRKALPAKAASSTSQRALPTGKRMHKPF